MRNEYLATRGKTQLLVKQTISDEITNGEYLTENTLMGDEKNIKTTSISFISGSSSTDAPIQPWRQRPFTYDVQGRVLTSTTAWSPAATMPDERVSSATITTTYDDAYGLQTESTIDALNNIIVV